MSDNFDIRRFREAEYLCNRLNQDIDKTGHCQSTVQCSIPRVVIPLMCPQSVDGITISAFTVSPYITPAGWLRYIVHLVDEQGCRVPHPSLGYHPVGEGSGKSVNDYDSLRAEIESIV